MNTKDMVIRAISANKSRSSTTRNAWELLNAVTPTSIVQVTGAVLSLAHEGLIEGNGEESCIDPNGGSPGRAKKWRLTVRGLAHPFALMLCMAIATGCATARTKYSDKNMRVMIDSEGLDYRQLVRLQTSLVQTGKFTVVDRAAGFKALKREQDRQHRIEADRYSDREKFAQWGKLYGVGTVLTANVQCVDKASFWNQQNYKQYCHQYINLVDTNTGEVFLAVEGEIDGNRQEVLGWADTVEKLTEAYPQYFKEHKLHDRLVKYQDESEQVALAQKKIMTPPVVQPQVERAPAQEPEQETDSE